MPVRKAKHKGRRSSNPAKKEISSRGSILTEEELCQHVTAQYIHGPGGTLRASAAKRYHQQEEQELENIVQLKRLDQHPALVLNADYQVRVSYDNHCLCWGCCCYAKGNLLIFVPPVGVAHKFPSSQHVALARSCQGSV